MKLNLAISTLVIAVLLSSCGENDHAAHDHADHGHEGKPLVVVPVPPYTGLVKRIAGDSVEIETLVGVGKDPHFFSPTPKQVARVNQADVYFTVGMPFEADLIASLKKSAPDLKVIDLTKGIELLELDHHHDHDHDHGHDHGDHGHGEEAHTDEGKHEEKPATESAEVDPHAGHGHEAGESDPHIWLSPELLMNQAKILHAVLEGLVGQDHSGPVHKNADALEAEITLLDYDLAIKLKPLKGQSFYVYHGAFGYFASAYGLTQESIQLGGKSPEPKRLTEIIEKAKAEGVKMIFVQPQFDQTAARAIADAIGGTVLSVDPLKEDVLANLRSIADAIVESK